jgi:hypothetical protein
MGRLLDTGAGYRLELGRTIQQYRISRVQRPGNMGTRLKKNNPNPQPEVIKTDYDYHFNGNVAIVRFKENGIDQVQILEKRDGQWKLYRRFMWDVNGFATAKKKGLLDRMAGDWELIPETVHLKDSVFTIPLFKAQMTRTTEGIQGVLQSTYMDRNGNKYDAYNKLWLLCDEGSGKIAYAETIKSANSNLFVVNGTGDISENIMKIDAATLTQDSKANIQWKILPDGHLSLETKVFDMQGKELDFTSLEFQRK